MSPKCSHKWSGPLAKNHSDPLLASTISKTCVRCGLSEVMYHYLYHYLKSKNKK